MKKFTLALSLLAMAASASAANLYIIGDATPYGWSTDDATALLSTADAPAVYTGTIYLTADQNFKFMTVPDWGNLEYGSAPDATLVDGEITLASGTDDSGYGQLRVPEAANYLITVDTENLKATIVKSAYQESEIKLCSLFMVGSATDGEWSVDNGTPLYQDAEAPYKYSAANLALKEGSFKIATVIKGGGSFDQKYFYFRSADDDAKMVLNQDGDLQWNIAEAANYDVTANTLTGDITIAKSSSSAISTVEDVDNAVAEYFTLDGVKVASPSAGIYICRRGSAVSKVIVR